MRTVIAALVTVPALLLLAPAAILGGAIVLFASVVGAVARRLESTYLTWADLIEFDPRLGWRPRPSLDDRYLAPDDDIFRVVTDDEGWPGRRRIGESDLVVIGDSFAFGYGAHAERMFTALDPSLRVKAIGAPGYSMVQGVRLIEDLATRLGGRLVVWFLFLENDLQDNLSPDMRGYRAPFVRLESGGWQIVDAHVRPERWRCSSQDSRRLFARFCVPGASADRAMAACDFLIARGHAACERAGASLAIVTIPHPKQLTADGLAELAASSGHPAEFDVWLPERRVAETCARLRIPCVHASMHLTRGDYKHREGIHWNDRGHRKIARLLTTLEASHRGDLSRNAAGTGRRHAGMMDVGGVSQTAPRPRAEGAAFGR